MTYLKSVLAGMVAVLAAATGERGARVGSYLGCKTVDLAPLATFIISQPMHVAREYGRASSSVVAA